jgi:hypothetical protein
MRPAARRIVALLLAALLALPQPAAAASWGAGAPPLQSCTRLVAEAPAWTALCIRQARFFPDVCAAIERLAWRYRLPPAYFARLIWQESRFDPHALSVAGAEGIAQVIPSTARLRGLRNPFEPAEALAKSAEYLAFLRTRFGNLGLAAAAYNGGDGRMSGYVARGGGALPWETRNYVALVTGLGVEAWLADPAPGVDFTLGKDRPFGEACVALARTETVPRLDLPAVEWKPWGVMLAQQFTRSIAVSHFDRVQRAYSKVLGGEKMMLLMARNPAFGPRLRYYAMVGRDTRKQAEALCAKLQAAGGACVVRRN